MMLSKKAERILLALSILVLLAFLVLRIMCGPLKWINNLYPGTIQKTIGNASLEKQKISLL